jgi:farnesol dehydrogenase
MDRVLITGASGFIGKSLAISLANSGTLVHAFVRQSSNMQGLHHPNIRIFTGDILDVISIGNAMRDCNKMFHLAGLAKMWMKDKGTYRDVNVGGTENALNVAYKLGVEKVLFVSTAGVLPPATIYPTNEISARRKELHTEYERTKNEAEELANDYYKKGLPVVTVHPTKVYGPGPVDDANTATMMIRDYINGQWKIIPGNGKGTMNYVYIDDVVSGLIGVMKKASSGSDYILGGDNASYDEFFLLIRELTNIRRRLYHLPYSIIRSIAWFEDIRTKVFGVKPIITSEWVRKLPYNWSKDTSKAKLELDYSPMSLRQGMKKTIDWLHHTKQITVNKEVYTDTIPITGG